MYLTQNISHFLLQRHVCVKHYVKQEVTAWHVRLTIEKLLQGLIFTEYVHRTFPRPAVPPPLYTPCSAQTCSTYYNINKNGMFQINRKRKENILNQKRHDFKGSFEHLQVKDYET